ncbi:MAG TPA: DUF5131 family protein [Firmicutes bacterium]|nr:DUF5131 family protein [Bacillota bacterium]
MATWNPWHGCHKISAGCQNCYVYRIDARYDRDSTKVEKTANFNLPLKRSRDGGYKLKSGETVYTCFTSDFFLPEADGWRAEAWQMIRLRQDLHFLIITKRIERFFVALPADWGSGYENVTICATAENQDRADFRLPLLLSLPARKKEIICEPLLEAVDLTPYLTPEIGLVVAGGESGSNARVCDYEWVLMLREQCRRAGVPFYFKQTGAVFRKDGRIYRIPRRLQHAQARKAGIDLP